MSRPPTTLLVDQSKLDNVVRELLMGLTTDGAHHKQYYLNKALERLVDAEWVTQARAEFGWDNGIPA